MDSHLPLPGSVARRLTALAAQARPRRSCEPRLAAAGSQQLLAGVGKRDITKPDVLVPGVDVNLVTNADATAAIDNPMYVKALLLRSTSLENQAPTTIGFVTLDVVSFGEIGHISNEFLPRVRARLERELGLDSSGIVFNVNHGHGIPCDDVEERTVQAVADAARSMVPVALGCGRGNEDRITENRRMFLQNGSETDTRGAYALPPDQEVESIGPIDPSIGLLRLDRLSDGLTLAIVYNFACHPIMGTPSGGNGADITGFASRLIEDGFSPGITMALFLQGCSGDINPIGYKDVDLPKNALPLGAMLGHSVLTAAKTIIPSLNCRVNVLHDSLSLPRVDASDRIGRLEAERLKLVESLHGTHLDLKSFVPLLVKYQMEGGGYPSAPASRYMHEEAMGRADLRRLDEINRSHLHNYIGNVRKMEEITRLNENIRLLKMHRDKVRSAGGVEMPLQADILTLRLGEFVLSTFPGELSVRIGLAVKASSPHPDTFIACYSNGYIFYSPTEEQLANTGAAQEDCDVMLGAGWQKLYENALAMHLEMI